MTNLETNLDIKARLRISLTTGNIKAAADRVRAVKELGGESQAIRSVYDPWLLKHLGEDLYEWGNYSAPIDYYLRDLEELAILAAECIARMPAEERE